MLQTRSAFRTSAINLLLLIAILFFLAAQTLAYSQTHIRDSTQSLLIISQDQKSSQNLRPLKITPQEQKLPEDLRSLMIKPQEPLSIGYGGKSYAISNIFRSDSTVIGLLKKGVKISPGGLAARQSWKTIQLANTLTPAELEAKMIQKGFTESFSNKTAAKILAQFRSVPGKGALIAVASGGATWAILEVTSPGLPWWQKIVIVLLVVGIAIAIYVVLRKKSVLR